MPKDVTNHLKSCHEKSLPSRKLRGKKRFLLPNELFGEISSLGSINRRTRNATAYAMSSSSAETSAIPDPPTTTIEKVAMLLNTVLESVDALQARNDTLEVELARTKLDDPASPSTPSCGPDAAGDSEGTTHAQIYAYLGRFSAS